MSDDQSGPIEPEAPAAAPPAGQPAYAMPVPAGYPAYAVPQQRPRFADQVMGMRAVVATALACLIVGGLGGFFLGRATGTDDTRFVRGPGFFQQRSAFPNGPSVQRGLPYGSNGMPNQPFRQGQSTGPSQNQNQNQNGR